MENKEIRRLLYRWGATTKTCARLQREVSGYRELIASAFDVAAAPLTGMPHGSVTSDKVSRQAEVYEHLKEMYGQRIEEIEEDICKAVEFEKAMSEIINTLDFTMRSVVEMRYKECRKMEVIAGRLGGYSVRRVQQIEEEAVRKVGECINIEIIS